MARPRCGGDPHAAAADSPRDTTLDAKRRVFVDPDSETIGTMGDCGGQPPDTTALGEMLVDDAGGIGPSPGTGSLPPRRGVSSPPASP